MDELRHAHLGAPHPGTDVLARLTAAYEALRAESG
jgi:hypothetical protein